MNTQGYKIKNDVLDFFAKNPNEFFTVKQVAKGLGIIDNALLHGVRVSIWELQSAKKIKCQKINNRYRWRFCGIVKITYENNKPAKVSIL